MSRVPGYLEGPGLESEGEIGITETLKVGGMTEEGTKIINMTAKGFVIMTGQTGYHLLWHLFMEVIC